MKPESSKNAPNAASYPRLLMVDDDSDHLALQSDLMRQHFPQASITIANSGAEAMQFDLDAFDVAVFDLQMPDCTGIELMQRIHETHDLPVIIVTGDRSGRSAAQCIRGGAVDFVVKHGDFLRVVPIVVEKAMAMIEIKRTNSRLEQELLMRNAELEKLNARLAEMASRDALTGLYNRRHFGELLNQLYAEADRHDTDLTCLMMDMDNFKRVNDHLGHLTGDRLLVMLAEVIRATVRESDVAGRFGGDEFVVLLPRTSPSEAQATAKRLLTNFRETLQREVPEAAVASLSIGMASRERRLPPTAESLVSLADEALYLAKTGGKDRIMVVRPTAAAAG